MGAEVIFRGIRSKLYLNGVQETERAELVYDEEQGYQWRCVCSVRDRVHKCPEEYTP